MDAEAQAHIAEALADGRVLEHVVEAPRPRRHHLPVVREAAVDDLGRRDVVVRLGVVVAPHEC